ncbi:MAG: hypothetical protein IJS61_00510 [Firmicutes bacterium]|nr:hypothetical protein [Bacillota bacterium]
MDNGYGCLGCLFVIVAIFYFLAYILAAVVSIGVLILIVAGIVGAILGMYTALSSFFYAVFAVNFEQVARELDKNYYKNVELDENGNRKYYEQFARSSYFNGQLIKDALNVSKHMWRRMQYEIQLCKGNIYLANSFFLKLLSLVKNGLQILSIVSFGFVISILLSVLTSALGLIITFFYRIFALICMGIERLFFTSKKISYRCDYCKGAYKLPIYVCPKCSVEHMSLRPSKFGIFKRVCACGEVLPCTGFSKGVSNLKRSELNALCPICKNTDKAGLSRPLGVALIGGVGAGKTTFKTSFLYKFINEDSLQLGLDVDIPVKVDQDEYGLIKECFIGKRLIAKTNVGAEYDITSFNLLINSKELDVPRYMHLYDMPGEVFERNNAKERLTHFSFSEGVVLIIDPYSLDVAANLDEDAGMYDKSIIDVNNLVQRFVDTVSEIAGMKKSGNKYNLPVAVAINKVDTKGLTDRIGDTAINRLMQLKPNVYNNPFNTMDYLCREFLKANGKGNAVTLLDNMFNNVHFFSCTSMGYVPKGALVRFMPNNIDLAVYWIITRSDSGMKNIWRKRNKDIIGDITEAQRKIYAANSSDYMELIEKQLK